MIAFGDYCNFTGGWFLDVEVQDLEINVTDFFF